MANSVTSKIVNFAKTNSLSILVVLHVFWAALATYSLVFQNNDAFKLVVLLAAGFVACMIAKIIVGEVKTRIEENREEKEFQAEQEEIRTSSLS